MTRGSVWRERSTGRLATLEAGSGTRWVAYRIDGAPRPQMTAAVIWQRDWEMVASEAGPASRACCGYHNSGEPLSEPCNEGGGRG